MDADKLIDDMFVECTGVALCDSGGADGRHWQQNRKVHPNTLPDITWELWNGSIEYTINACAYLHRAELGCNRLTDAFNELNIGTEDWDYENAYGVGEAAGELLDEVGADVHDGWNTYNGESALSQVLQGSYVGIDDEYYVILQVHQGCDVRGGYTDARLFTLDDCCLPCEDVYGTCTRDGHEYSIDNTYDGWQVRIEDDGFDGDPEVFYDTDAIELWL